MKKPSKYIEKKSYGAGLTNDQQQALERLDKFYNSDNLSFVLSGAAGTGKTFILDRFMRYINNKRIVVSAPTHKAVRVVERMTGKKGHTLQHLHGLRPNFNLSSFDIDKVKFDTIGEDKFRYFSTIINDEASMVSSSLFELNSIRSKQYNTKVLYVGDKFQLPPVSSDRQSIVFDLNNGYELTEIVRQEKGNPLLELLGILREDVPNNTSLFLDEIMSNTNRLHDDIGYSSLLLPEFIKSVEDTFTSGNLEKNVNYCRILCWTNMAVLTWNKFIRNKILNTPDTIICEDDLLTSYNTIVDDFFSPIITNSDDYVVVALFPKQSEHGFNGYQVTLRSLEDYRESTVFIVDHKDDTWINFYNKLEQLHEDAIYADSRDRSKRFKEYYKFKNLYISLIKFPLVDDRDDVNNFIVNMRKTQYAYNNIPASELMQFYNNKDNIRAWVEKDMDYGFALTVHKSQGSTYNTVFVNVLDIAYYNSNKRNPVSDTRNYPYAKEMRNKLLYTAMTRASNKAIMLI